MSTTTDMQPATAEIALTPVAPLDIAQTKAAMESYQQGLQALLDETDYQSFRSGGEDRRFVKRSGWRKIATWFSLNLEVRSIETDRDDDGRPIRARVVARATAPNGRFAEGDGAASLAERRFSKPEHDLPATATTRAMNRAISNLVGLGAVSAEEVEAPDTGAPQTGEPALPFGPDASEADERSAAQIIQKLHPSIDGFALVQIFKSALGVERLPEVGFRMVKAIEWGLSDGSAQVSGNENAESGT